MSNSFNVTLDYLVNPDEVISFWQELEDPLVHFWVKADYHCYHLLKKELLKKAERECRSYVFDDMDTMLSLEDFHKRDLILGGCCKKETF